ncbi:hypothetical protein [Leptospira sanjuanensis]|uniref:hypothetical protein n=1 Tax=Leptospira sanjuanensis TaxID=2879643 RepID=UPI001EE8E100|nr:hypothetical protein [Leptospira sanjuanensis]MCG6167217.1 hypothetical protein [Leptospira sanjuanensis]
MKFTVYNFIYDGNSIKELENIKLDEGRSVTLLLDLEGEPQSFKDSNGNVHYKIEYENKDYYIRALPIGYKKSMRVAPTSGTILRKLPNDEPSSAIKILPYNAIVKVLSEAYFGNDDPEKYKWFQVSYGSRLGWVEKKDLVSGEYDLRIIGKTFKDIVKDVYIKAETYSDPQIELKWKGVKAEKSSCRIGNKRCGFSISFQKDSNEQEIIVALLRYSIKGEGEDTEIVKKIKCIIDKENFMHAFTYVESNDLEYFSQEFEPVPLSMTCRSVDTD